MNPHRLLTALGTLGVNLDYTEKEPMSNYRTERD